MASHNLKYNGAPYTQAGELVHPDDTSVTAGAGAALCSCGTLSEELPNGAARRRWHKDHKEQAATTEPVQTALEVADPLAELPTTDSLAELLGMDPVPAPKARKAPAKPKAKPAAKADTDGYAEYSKYLNMDKGIKPGFWRSLGRDAAVSVVHHAYPMVQVEPDNAAFRLHFTGPHDDVNNAIDGVKQLWKDALAATKEWKATDAKFLGRSEEPLERRREGYHLTEEFYRNYGDRRAAQLQGK